MQKPTESFHEAEIKTSGCAVELYINGVLAFLNYEPGGMAVDWPVNEYILESGVQQFELKLSPLGNDEFIMDKARAGLNFYVQEGSNVPRNLLSEFKAPSFADVKLPFFELSGTFIAQVPYKLEGWKNSLDLRKEKPQNLIKELTALGDQFYKIYSKADYSSYHQLNSEREYEFSIANYYSEEEKAMNKKMAFQGTNMYIKPLNYENHKLVFYADGRLVSFQVPMQPPGFMFEPINGQEHDGFIVMALFHRKKKNDRLTLIR